MVRSDNSKKVDVNANHFIGNRFPKKERPFCTYCNYHGHTIEKCYKIHGNPPGYKQKQKPQTLAVNQVSAQVDHVDVVDQLNNQVGNFLQTLNTTQYQHLMTMLSNHLASSNQPSDQHNSPSTSFIAGICLLASSNPAISSMRTWIIDSSASRHICSHANVFISLRPIRHSTINLPNTTCIPVHLCGDIKLGSHLILKDVLFVPQFRFNLLFVSALTVASLLTTSFFFCHVHNSRSPQEDVWQG